MYVLCVYECMYGHRTACMPHACTSASTREWLHAHTGACTRACMPTRTHAHAEQFKTCMSACVHPGAYRAPRRREVKHAPSHVPHPFGDGEDASQSGSGQRDCPVQGTQAPQTKPQEPERVQNIRRACVCAHTCTGCVDVAHV